MSREMLNAIDGEEFGPALDILMDKHICNYSARLLRSITGLDNRTISNMKKGENLTKSNVISACLGIHIPFRVSDHMLGLADLTLKMDSKSKVSDDNEVYDMILHDLKTVHFSGACMGRFLVLPPLDLVGLHGTQKYRMRSLPSFIF
mgnify:CR=1 FL=1